MIIPHEFTIKVQPVDKENSRPILTWTFHYRGQMYGNAVELPGYAFEDRDAFKMVLDLLINGLMQAYEAVAREGTGEVTKRDESC